MYTLHTVKMINGWVNWKEGPCGPNFLFLSCPLPPLSWTYITQLAQLK